MNFFKKPAVALVLAAVLILASTALSVNLKFGEECDEVSDGFYEGVFYDSVLHESISSQLDIIRESAENIAHIAEGYGADTVELFWATDAIRLAFLYSEHEASYIYYCYEELMDELRDICDDYGREELSEADYALVEGYLSDIQAAQELIKNSGYNESVRRFNKERLNVFTEFLGDFAGVDFPELFS